MSKPIDPALIPIVSDGTVKVNGELILYYSLVTPDPEDPANDHEPYWCFFTPDRVQYGGLALQFPTQEDLERGFKEFTLERKRALCSEASDYFKRNKRVYLLALNKAYGYNYLSKVGNQLRCSVEPQAFSQDQLFDLINDRAFRQFLLEYGSSDIRVLDASVLFDNAELTDLFQSLYRGYKAFA